MDVVIEDVIFEFNDVIIDPHLSTADWNIDIKLLSILICWESSYKVVLKT